MNPKLYKKLIFVISIFLAACAPSPGQALAVEATSIPTQTRTMAAQVPTSTPSPIPEEKEAPNPNFETVDCTQKEGSMQLFELESSFLDQGLQFRIFIPPCYQEQKQRNFPVLYLIHGQTFNDDQWDRLGADEAAQQLIADGEASPFLIVMPFDLSYAQPSIDPFAEAFINELVPFIDATFRTIDEAEYRAIGGLSRGASWAIHFALRYPEIFSAVGGHSPPIFREDAPLVRKWLEEIPPELMPRIWLDIGEKDQVAILDSAIWFEGLLSEQNIPHEWHLFPGNHNEAYWSSHVELYLRWYTQYW